MSTATIIMVANRHIPSAALNCIIQKHRQQPIDPDIVVAYDGEAPNDIDAGCVNASLNKFGLSRLRNFGAIIARSEWLIFADADTYYTDDLGQFLNADHPATRGNKRYDVELIPIDDDKPDVQPYEVVAGPMIVHGDLFREVGGYHMGYEGYGHEDGDFLFKLPGCRVVDAGAIHILRIHNLMAGSHWMRGARVNEALYNRRIGMGRESMIAADVRDYAGLYTGVSR